MVDICPKPFQINTFAILLDKAFAMLTLFGDPSRLHFYAEVIQYKVFLFHYLVLLDQSHLESCNSKVHLFVEMTLGVRIKDLGFKHTILSARALGGTASLPAFAKGPWYGVSACFFSCAIGSSVDRFIVFRTEHALKNVLSTGVDKQVFHGWCIGFLGQRTTSWNHTRRLSSGQRRDVGFEDGGCPLDLASWLARRII